MLAVLCYVVLLQECINLIKELGAPVEHIVLTTFAYEHKVFVGPFARRFPKAKVSSCAQHTAVRALQQASHIQQGHCQAVLCM